MENMKKFINRNNFIILSITLVLAFISMVNFSVAFYSNNAESILINLKSGNVIKEISVSSNQLNLEDYQSDKIRLNKISEEEKELNVIEDTSISIKVSVIDNVNIIFDKIGDLGISYSIDGQEYKSNNNFLSIYPSKFDILKSSIRKVSIIIFIISYFVLLLAILVIKDSLKRVKENNLKIVNIVALLISTFLLYLSNIYFFMMINRIFAIIPGILLSLYILTYFKFSIKEWKNIFLLISAVVGTMMIFIITPGNVPDEPSHYVRGYVDSLFINKQAKDEVKLPVDMNRFFYKFTHDVHSLKVKYSGNSYMTELTKKIDYADLSDIKANYENTRHLSFLPYIPSLLVNFVGRNLELPILIVFLLCRLVNFVISTVLCYQAINITPKFKKIYAVLAIFPIFLQQAAGIDMDYLTNSIVFLFMANIFKYRFNDKKLNPTDILILSGLGIALGLCKFGYFPILLLALLIPNQNFNNKKCAILFKTLIFVIPILISCMANLVAVSNPNNSTDKYTLQSVLSNPLNSAIICVKTFIARFELDTFSGLINGFGWSTKYHLDIALWTLAAIIIIIIFSDNEEVQYLNKKDRIVMLAVWGIIYLMLYGVAFTEWTSIQSTNITGLQSRYFIPILPLFYILISNCWIKLNISDKWKFYTILLFIAEILSNISVIVAFY